MGPGLAKLATILTLPTTLETELDLGQLCLGIVQGWLSESEAPSIDSYYLTEISQVRGHVEGC